ncbi:MAG TPA: exo-beta-N-acetylmuramidase NamZ domain-containing protein [Pyrinomonadaceae bacterium]|nr:exo-beta-N-acetylmuramidase NamZ domain-containing protein [Pyrinomonadaceae bacterium]
MNLTRTALAIIVSLALVASAAGVTLPPVQPSKVSVDASRLAFIDGALGDAVAKKELPGAVVLVARRGGVVWRKAYGSRALVPQREAMTADTIFDLASLTKIVATTTSIMILVERGKIRLSDSVSVYIPELKGEGRERITIERLLTHTSGYAPDFDLSEQWSGYDEMLKRLYAEPLRSAPGSRFVYSDINFITLGEVVRRASGQTLDEFARKNIYEPLGMRDTGFRPRAELLPRIAPTENVRGMRSYLGGMGEQGGAGDRILRGEVHDPTANRMGGVAGHAGLFSTADDLAIFCQMILNGGEYGGVRILSPLGVAEMTRPRQVTEEGGVRGLGWDINTSFSSNRGDLFPFGSFGHTGFTGTSVWIDPASETFVVFLSNRVHPDGKGDVGPVRARVANIVAGALTDAATVARARLEQSEYAQEITAGLARFTASLGEARAGEADGMLAPAPAEVLNGVDVLERDGFKELQGLRVGLITNHTGRDRAGRQTIDVLREAQGVKLSALFSPEHGIRGQADEKVSDSVDEKTGLPVFSLYGETRRPKPEELKNLDALVYDVQDAGSRFYTYISTLGYAMEAAAQARIPFFVLDRPNPIGGVDVEGPLADANKLSFTAYHTIPVRHGLTVGELARLYNEQRKLGCDLRVVKMENWRRAMWLDATGQTWVNPSPNMRSLTEATLYPGVGLLETTNLSVGRGTDTPFELVGAPWLDGQKLAAYLDARGIAGVRFVPVRFTPRASVFKDQECGGVNIIVTDRALFRPVRAGIEIAVALRRLYPQDWKVEDYARLLANADALERVKRADEPESIVASWQTQLDEFRRARSRVLLYR